MTEDPEYLEQKTRIALAIGMFLYAFNQIELMTYVALNAVCDEPFLARIAQTEYLFEARRALLVRILEWKRAVPVDVLEEWKAAWEETRVLAEQRNHIAHGQISMLGKPEEPDEQRFGVASIRKVGKPDFNISLATIEALVPKARASTNRLSAVIERVRACPWKDELVPRSRFKSEGASQE